MNKQIILGSFVGLVTVLTPAIARADSSDLMSQQTGGNQIAGSIIRIEDDDFILDTGNRQIKVDAEDRPMRQANFQLGEQVTVIGDFDDEEFDARKVIRANGATIQMRD